MADRDSKGRRVYSNRPTDGETLAGSSAPWFAPTLTPLIIGFALLVGFIFFLGTFSEHRLKSVSRTVLDLERQYATQLSSLHKLRVALNNLNTEARSRAMLEAGGGLMPPDLRLGDARKQLEDLLPILSMLENADLNKRRLAFRDIRSFIQVTEDLDSYSLEGFESFRLADSRLVDLIEDAGKVQEEILARGEQLEEEATGLISYLTLIAIFTSIAIAAGTTWAVQRQFRLMLRSLAEARRERRFSAQILEGMASAVAAIDRDGTIRSANPRFFAIFPTLSNGSSVEDDVGSSEARELLSATTRGDLSTPKYQGRWPLTLGEKRSRRTFDAYTAPLEFDKEEGFILSLIDVTEAVESEIELRKKTSLAAVGQAVAQVAHEIKNPLGSIRLGVSMLRNMSLEEGAFRTIDLVERGIDHLNKLTIDVTQFSRQKSPNLAESGLHQLLDASLEMVQDRVKTKNIWIEKHYWRETIVGMWDSDELKKVFVNLLVNAIEASRDNSRIQISTEYLRNPSTNGANGGQPRALVAIRDQGSGMDQETRSKIFDPFFTTKKQGTGLGLAIVKKIVELHSGTINVETEPHEGTSFHVELPLMPGA
jgi:signal transduction histidine kinase